MIYELDIERSQLLVNVIIAAAAVIGIVASILAIWRQLRHQAELETKKLEQEYVRELLSVLDKPLDLALSNVMEVDYIRASEPGVLATAESLHRSRPHLMTDWRNAYQTLTNTASTLTTVLPACRRQRGIGKDEDSAYKRLYDPLIKLVEAYDQLGRTYGNTATLIHLNVDHFLADHHQKEANDLVIRVRKYGSDLLAELYA